MWHGEHTRVLLIEDNPEDALLIQEMLKNAGSDLLNIELTYAETLEKGLNILSTGAVDVVLLDLVLPGSQGLDTFVLMRVKAPDLPVIVLSNLDDEAMALEAVTRGAQDYLVKSQMDGRLLVRVIRYAIERNRLQVALRQVSFVDELTGLYNRRGFFTFAEQYWSLARRTRKGFILIYADLDGLKQINDTFGHQAGDEALILTAKILRETFRQSDIVSRFGGDEFAILAMEAQKESQDAIRNRLERNIARHVQEIKRGYSLSLSAGMVTYDPISNVSLKELLVKADEELYRIKKSRAHHP